MQNSSSHTQKLLATTAQINEMLEYYEGYLTYNTNNYMIARVKIATVTITFYRTNVVLFQGVDATTEYNFWAKKFNIQQIENDSTPTTDYSILSVVGSDEVGTGDYFGPIVVCATYTTKETASKLRQLGVKDSKLLTDNQIISLSMQVSKLIPYSIIILDPYKFNSLSPKHDNLNFVKSYLHNKAINSILKKLENVKPDAILIDEFTPKEKYLEYLKNDPNLVTNITTIVHGENAHIGIAAASILARTVFIRELKRLSNEYDIELLKGAGREVDRTAISFVKSYGFEGLKHVAKLKFSNTERVKEYFENNPNQLRKTKDSN